MDLRRSTAAIGCTWALVCSPFWGCGEDEVPPGPPPCGSYTSLQTLIPGPRQAGHDALLAAKARRHDRMFHAVNARATGLNADVRLVDSSTLGRDLFRAFAASDDWDFEANTGRPLEPLVVWQKSAGLYAGVGVAADAFRYGALRDAGEDCQEVERARAQLLRAMNGLELASAIPATPGVTARSLVNLNFPHEGHGEPTPLFDANGDPLPAEKNNGEWRNDLSGAHPNYIWEDSLSRDMLVGWAMAYGAVAEVADGDPTLQGNLLDRLRGHAADIGRALSLVRESGFDLEIPDADGRLTFHAYLNENTIDRIYLPGANNGFNAVMALGIIAALAHASQDPALASYRDQELVEARNLPKMVDDDLLIVSLGVGANFSNFNMAFTGMFLANRYLTHDRADGFLVHALDHELYQKDEIDGREPNEMGQSFFDLIYAAGRSGARFDRPGREVPTEALERGLNTLREYSDSPYFNDPVTNCDAAEIAAKRCTLRDGTQVDLLGDEGRGDKLVAVQPIPMRVRPPSNYHWRSNPYIPNDGGGGTLLPAVDFRVVYWMGRYLRVE